MISASIRKALVPGTAIGLLLILNVLPVLAQTRKLGDGLSFEGAGASFIGKGKTTTLEGAGGSAHIIGSKNTLTLAGGCRWLEMVGSNNAVVVALAKGANIDAACSNNSI